MKPPFALVTGGSRGIGRGVCVELARAGFQVAINYCGNEAAALECLKLCKEATPSDSPSDHGIFQADVSRREDRERLLGDVTGRYGWIDVLVNNAGVAPSVRADLLDASEESFDRLIAVNLKGPYFLSQGAARFWLSRGDTLEKKDPKPKIVTVGSISAYTASVNRGDYCVSKAGLGMMTKLFAVRLADHGIGVFELRPGIIATDMTQPVHDKYDRLIAEGLTPIRRWGTPDDVGRAVVAIAQEKLPFSTGEVINIDGGFHLQRL